MFSTFHIQHDASSISVCCFLVFPCCPPTCKTLQWWKINSAKYWGVLWIISTLTFFWLKVWPFSAGWKLKIETKINSNGFVIRAAIQTRLDRAHRKCNTQTRLCIWPQRVTLSACIMFTFWALCYCSGQTDPGHETIKILWYICEQCSPLIFARPRLTMTVSFVLVTKLLFVSWNILQLELQRHKSRKHLN